MLFLIFRMLVIIAMSVLAGASAIHTLESVKYRIPELNNYLLNRKILKPEYVVGIAAALIDWYLPMLFSIGIQNERRRETICAWIVLAVFVVTGTVIFLRKKKIPQRKEFVFTRRILRVIILTALVNALGVFALHAVSLSPYLMYAGAELVVILAAFVMNPLEDRINRRYYSSAAKKLEKRKKLIRIGITGSYGKTMTKLILRDILSRKYRVLATPPAFATAMGISRTVNERLNNEHQIFIAEMGAQAKGEIRQMCRIVEPQYGIITCIGNSHLDSFGSVESIAQAKFELIQSLPAKGRAFFGSDGSYCDRLYGICKKTKFRAAIGDEVESYMHADHAECGVHGTRFELICADGERAWMHTRLLGTHAVRDIVLAACVAKQLGMSMTEIAEGVDKIKPIPRRMQLVAGDINIIDDSENTIPETAEEALNVLSEFPGRRILVTGGFPELESNREDRSCAFGTRIDGCADYVVLVDPTLTKPIMDGLMLQHFPKSSVRMVQEEADAVSIIKEIAQKGDTILYEGIYPEA